MPTPDAEPSLPVQRASLEARIRQPQEQRPEPANLDVDAAAKHA